MDKKLKNKWKTFGIISIIIMITLIFYILLLSNAFNYSIADYDDCLEQNKLFVEAYNESLQRVETYGDMIDEYNELLKESNERTDYCVEELSECNEWVELNC